MEDESPSTSTSSHEGDPTRSEPKWLGFALHPKKRKSFVTPKLVEELERAGFKMKQLDPSKPLEEQGRVDVLLHKMTSRDDWSKRLENYAKEHPRTCIVDHPDDIAVLANRMTMLRPARKARLNTPAQFLLESPECAVQEALETRGMKLPLVAKPLRAGGSSGSHTLGIIYDQQGMKDLLDGKLEPLRPPVVLQQFLEHEGVLFKVYVLGDTVQAVHRPSVHDARLKNKAKETCTTESEKGNSFINRKVEHDLGPGEKEVAKSSEHEEPHVQMWTYMSRTCPNGEKPVGLHVQMPPQEKLIKIARKLRDVLNLELFNFDLIRCREHLEEGERDVYYIIDINYFPGYSKMPGYEKAFASFLKSYVEGEKENSEKRE
uniref:Inositol-tetrakisphosphate 1-kinase n=1 Tax=Picocystis salinarum TaxID=88271 RepID=A0A7S3XBX7_9CHLO